MRATCGIADVQQASNTARRIRCIRGAVESRVNRLRQLDTLTGWRDVVGGVPEGFAEFVQARSRALLRSAWFMTGDWFLAEDRVQTALMHIWPRWERIASSA